MSASVFRVPSSTVRRFAAGGTMAAVIGTSLFALSGTAYGETVDGTYQCTGELAPQGEVTVQFTRVADPGDLRVGDSLPLEVDVTSDLDLSTASDGTVDSASVDLSVLLGDDEVSLTGTPALDGLTWRLTGEHTLGSAGHVTLHPGAVTITQRVTTEDEPAEDGGPNPFAEDTDDPEDADRAPHGLEPSPFAEDTENTEDGSAEDGAPANSPTATPSTEPSPDAADLRQAPTEATQEQPHEDVVTECAPSDEPPLLGEFDVKDKDSGDGDGSGEPDVTATGLQWEGVWVCVSDNSGLLPGFEGPGEVRLVFSPDALNVGENTHLVAENVAFSNMPARSETVGTGNLGAVLRVPLAGGAAPTEAVEIGTTNSQPVEPQDTTIVFAEPDPVPLTPQSAGELRAELGELVLTTALSDGTVTHTCTAGTVANDGTGDNADNRPTPQDNGNRLPVTGPALAGLIGTAAAALLSGAGAMALGRTRTSALDDED